ncbi:hypothetical protein [Paraburkholderia rhynchosiae]|uniref:Uncharacterized protein n=1 Tax=Paraburkholderia rhynchosiae TaxID=487049 RepID=A0A2N7W618_9BURK|nr:hypothetical protein [Paraburkholderia rhynchosiae]PMS24829.1 hypothetical protein C0Z16_30270 [Paraburkholderia rhynchosiae]CAB3725418.1 hypothetical protein LMG27174_05319 [Paraburkholderia rhynchosiae]
MRTQRTASTFATDHADPHAPRQAGGNASRSRAKSRFSGAANAVLSQLRSIGGGSRPGTGSKVRPPVANGAPAPATLIAKEDPVSDLVKWINHQRRAVDAPPAVANGGVAKLTREQALAMNKAVPKRAPPAPPGANSAAATTRSSTTEPAAAADDPAIESDDDLFELPLPAAPRAPHKSLQQLLDETRDFHSAPEWPIQTRPHSTAATPAHDDDLIEVDPHSGRVNAGANAAAPSVTAATGRLKSALRKPDAARGEIRRHVSWHPDVRDTKLASAEATGGSPQRTTTEPKAPEKAKHIHANPGSGRMSGAPTLARSPARREQPGDGAPSASSVTAPPTATPPAARARRSGITGMLGRMVRLPQKLWR